MTVADLTQSQRQFLRRSAHDLRPTVQVGKNGVSPALIASAAAELEAHELIKVKFMEFREERRELSEQLAADLGAELVAVIGNVAVLYREQRDPQKRQIRLPVS